MASDAELELKQAILRGIEREIEAMLAQRGELLPVALDNPGLGDSSASSGYVDAFATGFDSGSGETTMPFVLDFSILTDGSSGDILTG